MFRRHRALGAAVVTVSLITACIATNPSMATATVANPVGPNQPFVGMVNGRLGLGRNGPVVIDMACFGPVGNGQTGHPMAGQTIELRRRLVDRKRFGFTGPDGNAVGAFFGPPPPSASPVANNVQFTKYGLMAMPTSLVLPCAGTGHVLFIPLPVVGGSRGFSVPVTYVGQP